MNAMAKRIFSLGATALLASCTPPGIDMTTESVGGHIRVTLSQDWGVVFSRNQTPCVGHMGLYPPGAFRRDATTAVWRIEARDGVQCLDLASVTIGETPEGFKETKPLQAVPGSTYVLSVFGIGMAETEITP